MITSNKSILLHKIHCQEPWFSLIRQGKKPVEGRKASPSYKSIKVDDTIEFFGGQESFICVVEAINRYSSLEEYLRCETLERALPGVKTMDEGIRIYLQWSTREQINKHGFLGIQVRLQGL